MNRSGGKIDSGKISAVTSFGVLVSHGKIRRLEKSY